MGIVLAPSVKLKNWSFDAELAESGYKWQKKIPLTTLIMLKA